MNKFDLAVLDSALNDYESVGTVGDEIAALLQLPISREDLFKAFVRLASQGLMRGYVLAKDNQWKVIATSEMNDPAAVWFLTTKEGRAIIEREWDQYFNQ